MNENVAEAGPGSLVARSLDDFRPLNTAESAVVAAATSGDLARLGDGLLPEWDEPSRTVRADFLRFLILGGDDSCRTHEKGLRICGAVIAGTLDLEGCKIPRDIGLKDCRFDASLVLRSAIIDNLFVDGSTLPSLQADRLEARGGLIFRNTTVSGSMQLRAARIGGNLEADGATILDPNGTAIDADGLEAQGGILLRGAHLQGRINVSGARLGGDINAVGARIEDAAEIALNGDGMAARGDFALRGATIVGEISLVGAVFGGDIDCRAATLEAPKGHALRLNRARIEGAFILGQGASVKGTLDLTATEIGAFDDEAASWPQHGDLLLNRCRYGAFIGGPVDAASRLDWLARQVPERWGQDFWPQPYEHLATVLRDMGHQEDARTVLIEKERLQRRARRKRAKHPLLRLALASTDALLAVTVRYGRQPLLALVWLAVFWAIGVAVFGYAEQNGALKPNSPVVLRALEWTMCEVEQGQTRYMPSAGQMIEGRALPGQTQLSCFLVQPESSSYPEFNRWMYSLDSLLPVMEIGQKQFWRPNPVKPSGTFTINYYYFQSIVGWALSLLAVAGFSGLVKSR